VSRDIKVRSFGQVPNRCSAEITVRLSPSPRQEPISSAEQERHRSSTKLPLPSEWRLSPYPPEPDEYLSILRYKTDADTAVSDLRSEKSAAPRGISRPSMNRQQTARRMPKRLSALDIASSILPTRKHRGFIVSFLPLHDLVHIIEIIERTRDASRSPCAFAGRVFFPENTCFRSRVLESQIIACRCKQSGVARAVSEFLGWQLAWGAEKRPPRGISFGHVAETSRTR